MPDLEQQAVTEWLAEFRPATTADAWPPAVRAIETEADNSQLLQALGTLFDRAAGSDLDRLSAALRAVPLRNDLAAVLAQLGAARPTRLLHWLAEIEIPDCHAVIAALVAGDDPAACALRATLAGVNRPALLRRIFAPERIAALRSACRSAFEEAA